MNAGTNANKAYEQAIANADKDNKIRYVWVWAGSYWIDTIPPNINVVGPYKVVYPTNYSKSTRT